MKKLERGNPRRSVSDRGVGVGTIIGKTQPFSEEGLGICCCTSRYSRHDLNAEPFLLYLNRRWAPLRLVLTPWCELSKSAALKYEGLWCQVSGSDGNGQVITESTLYFGIEELLILTTFQLDDFSDDPTAKRLIEKFQWFGRKHHAVRRPSFNILFDVGFACSSDKELGDVVPLL